MASPVRALITDCNNNNNRRIRPASARHTRGATHIYIDHDDLRAQGVLSTISDDDNDDPSDEPKIRVPSNSKQSVAASGGPYTQTGSFVRPASAPRAVGRSSCTRCKDDETASSFVSGKPDWYEPLNDKQFEMFKEVLFDLLEQADKDLLNAKEFCSCLRRLSIDISVDDVKKILSDLTCDSSGTVSVEQVLSAMPYNESFLSRLSMYVWAKEKTKAAAKKRSKNKKLFLKSLVQFPLTLSKQEVERYYNSVGTSPRTPHLISTYSAAARAHCMPTYKINAEEEELLLEHDRRWKDKSVVTPYAEPQIFIDVQEVNKQKTKKQRRKHAHSATATRKHHTPSAGSRSPKRRPYSANDVYREQKDKGWDAPHIEMPKVEIYGVKTKPGVDLTVDDIPRIRDAVSAYYDTERTTLVESAKDYWDQIETDSMKPALLENFRRVYLAYFPENKEDVHVIGPMMQHPSTPKPPTDRPFGSTVRSRSPSPQRTGSPLFEFGPL